MSHPILTGLFGPAFAAHHVQALGHRSGRSLTVLRRFLLTKVRSGARRSAALGAIGLISAFLSNYYAGWDGSPYPVLPGIYFSIVLVAGVYVWVTRKALELLVVFAATNIAWWGAYEASLNWTAPLTLCGLLSGLIGSFVTICGITYACKGFGTVANWSRTLIIGALSGMLLQFLDGSNGTTLPLFLVWQASVAASIGYGLITPRVGVRQTHNLPHI